MIIYILGEQLMFNLFYVLYMGGVWECMIGVIYCILDNMLRDYLV